MAKSLVGLSGSAADLELVLFDFRLTSGRTLADVSNAVGVPTVDYKVGAVSEITIPAVDDGTLRRANALTYGGSLIYDGAEWDVVAIDREYKGATTNLTITIRSALARQLRNTTGPTSWSNITPAQWIRTVVKKAGGQAIAEDGSKARKIVMKRGETVLDVISSLASDTGVEWVEHGGVVYFGTPWWAYQNGPGLPMWNLSIAGDNPLVLTASSRSSLDDRQNAAEITLSVPQEVAKVIRPWHTVNLSGLTKDDNGLWLVRDVNYELRPSAASITATRPLKGSPKKGSSSGGGDGADTGDGDGGSWIPKPDKKYAGCNFTPRKYVERAKAAVGNSYENRACLRWVSEIIRGYPGLGGYYAKYVWKYAPESAIKYRRDFDPPIGSVVVWDAPTGGDAGHVGIAIGNGRCISATGGSVVNTSIRGGFDAANYLGAVTPPFTGNYPQHPNG